MAEEDTPSTEPQPEGQGPVGDAPYAEYLSRIPEEVRGDVEPVFKDWDANTTRKFQEHSEYRKQWEPYEQAGLNEYDPAALQAHLQMLNDPTAYQAWVTEQAAQFQQTTAPDGGQGPVDPDDPVAIRQALTQQIEQLSAQQQQMVGPLYEFMAGIEQEKVQQQQQAHEEGVFKELDPKGDLTTEDKTLVKAFASNHDGQDALRSGFRDYQQYRANIEKQVFASKQDVPAGAEAGGSPSVSPPERPEGMSAFEFATQQAQERVLQDRAG